MDTATFANKIRTKYPDAVSSDGRRYADIPDRELAQKIVEKYPVYKDQITDFSTSNLGEQKEPSLGQRLKSDITNAGEKVQQAITGEGEYKDQGSIARGTQATAAAFTAPVKMASEFLPESVRNITKKAGDIVGGGFSAVTDKMSELPLFKEIGMLEGQGYISPETAPELYRVVDALKTSSASGEIANDILAIVGATKSLEKGINKGTELTKEGIDKYKKAKFEKTVDVNKTQTNITPEKATEMAWEDIQPKASAGTKKAYAAKGAVSEQGLLKKSKLLPTEADKPMLDTVQQMYQKGELKTGMSSKEKFSAIEQKAKQINSQQKNYLFENNKRVNAEPLMENLNLASKENTIPFSKDVAAKGAYDSAIDTFKSKLGDGDVTLTKLDDALTKFDNEMDKFGAWEREATGELTDVDKARIGAIRDIHTSVRDFIADEVGGPWKALRQQESNLYQVAKRMANGQLASTIGKSKISQSLGEHPLIRKGLWWAGMGAAGGMGFGAVSGGLGQSQ